MSESQSSVENEKKHCWVCFATEDEDINEIEKSLKQYEWVRPCHCKGTSKWVHQNCLQRWIDEKQRGNLSESVTCSQCKFEYIIYYPKPGPLIYLIQQADQLIYKICPFIAAGVIVGTIYWTAVTYGAITIMQVMGHEKGLTLLEASDPLLLIIALPAIPITLILGRMIRWEDQVLYFWRKFYPKLLTAMSYCLYPTSAIDQTGEGGANNKTNGQPTSSSSSYDMPQAFATPSTIQQPLAPYDHVSATRILCGALLLPTIASIVGKLVAPSIKCNLQRSLLGGLTFLTVKGILKLYYKQTQFLRNAHRKILNNNSNCTSASPSFSGPSVGGSSAVSIDSENSTTAQN